jgi:GT2 family glycosyltransferase
MQVSVIIVNYNTFELTSKCIQSIKRHSAAIRYEIILVDNASTECDPEKFLTGLPDIVLIKSLKNGGFAYGNNLGIKKAKGEYILLLNSDTVLVEDSLGKIVEYARKQKQLGVVGCRMIYPDSRIQYTARRFRSVAWELLDLFRFVLYMVSYQKRSQIMLGKYFRHDENIECDWVNGAFMLIPVHIIEKLPGKKLDERFFMYGEDQLWCEQIKNLGYRILFYSGTTIIHIGSASTGLEKHLSLRKIMMQNELAIMQARKGKGLYYLCFKALFTSKELARNFIKSLVYKFAGRMIS